MSLSVEQRLQEVVSFLRDEDLFRLRRREIATLISAFRARLLYGSPLSLIAYWGIGTKRKIGEPEREAVAFQQQWMNRLVQLLALPLEVEFLLTDTHARVNHIPQELADEYIISASDFLDGCGYKLSLMSAFLASREREGATEPASNFTINADDWATLPPATRAEFERLARKRSAHDSAQSAAIAYYRQNLIESAHLSLRRSTCIFLTYQMPSMSFMAPCLPSIHTYVSGGRNVRRPWFEERSR